MEVVALLSQGRTAAAQCGLFTHRSVPVIFEPPCTTFIEILRESIHVRKLRMRARTEIITMFPRTLLAQY